jgi:hypothetical protein
MNETTKMLVGVEILLLGAAWYFDGVLTLVFGVSMASHRNSDLDPGRR